MGILNITPDSFYDGGRYSDENAILRQVELMLNEGASFIDIGSVSTRPGAEIPDVETEWKRMEFSLKLIVKHFPESIISVDTTRAAIAERAVNEGAALINDISAGEWDSEMLKTVAALNVPYILMHRQGVPQTMQINPVYENVTLEIIQYFSKRIEVCRNAGIKDIIIDPGFGFGKNIQHNYTLLRELQTFDVTGLPILAGLSRKRMIWQALEITPEQALNGTTALNMVALLNGANILRVHDVKEAIQCVTLFKNYKTSV
ncbi:MAG: dihydropteroate synthase [Bacteroidetes bacterium]|nr:dihydropteroate synthase [Bacteroidota bacterium]